MTLAPSRTDESHIGIWLGLTCVALALLPWIPFDWWLKKNGHEYITTEFREALQDKGAWGLIVSFFVCGILGVGAYHFYYQKTL